MILGGFWEDFGGFWESVESFGEACGLIRIYDRFSMFSVDFGRVFGSHVGTSLEAKTDENGKKIDICTIL